MDMYSRVKRRRKSLRRNSYGIQNHHEVSTEGEEEGNEVSLVAVIENTEHINMWRLCYIVMNLLIHSNLVGYSW